MFLINPNATNNIADIAAYIIVSLTIIGGILSWMPGIKSVCKRIIYAR